MPIFSTPRESQIVILPSWSRWLLSHWWWCTILLRCWQIPQSEGHRGAILSEDSKIHCPCLLLLRSVVWSHQGSTSRLWKIFLASISIAIFLRVWTSWYRIHRLCWYRLWDPKGECFSLPPYLFSRIFLLQLFSSWGKFVGWGREVTRFSSAVSFRGKSRLRVGSARFCWTSGGWQRGWGMCWVSRRWRYYWGGSAWWESCFDRAFWRGGCLDCWTFWGRFLKVLVGLYLFSYLNYFLWN